MRSGRWEPVELDLWPGPQGKPGKTAERYSTAAKKKVVIKTEHLPDGRTKTILKDKATGRIIEKIG